MYLALLEILESGSILFKGASIAHTSDGAEKGEKQGAKPDRSLEVTVGNLQV